MTSANAILSSATNATIFCVFAPRGSMLGTLFDQAGSYCSLESSGSLNAFFYVHNTGGAAATGPAVVNTFEIRTLVADGTHLTNRRNAVAGTPASYSGDTGVSGFSLGSGGAGGSRTDVAELIVFNTDLSSGDIDLVEAYLAEKYGIAI